MFESCRAHLLLFDPAAAEWIREHVTPTGEIELVQERFWSSVLRIPVADGPRVAQGVHHGSCARGSAHDDTGATMAGQASRPRCRRAICLRDSNEPAPFHS